MPEAPERDLVLSIVHSSDLSPGDRRRIVELCNRAYEEDLTATFERLAGGTHVLGTVGGELVSHAMWVTRWLQIWKDPLLRTAYVELVATAADHRRRGYAAAVMRCLQQQILDYDIGALSPFSTAYYGRLGWELWRGPLLERRAGELIASPDDEEVMILRLPRTPALDLTAPLSVEWREGEVW